MRNLQYFCTKCKEIHKKEDYEEIDDDDDDLYESHQIYKAVNFTDKKHIKLVDLITACRDKIEEEFDMMEIIEDEVKNIFECNMDCKTCSTEEQGECFTNWRKANLYYLRKIAQDEYVLKDIVRKMEDLRQFISDLYYKVKEKINEAEKVSEELDLVEWETEDEKKTKKKDKNLDYFQ